MAKTVRLSRGKLCTKFFELYATTRSRGRRVTDRRTTDKRQQGATDSEAGADQAK